MRFFLGIFLVLVGCGLILASFTGMTGYVVAEPNELTPIGYFIGFVALITGVFLIFFNRRYRLVSKIDANPGLERLAREATTDQSVQRDIDHLTNELNKGNTRPGIGSAHLFGNVYYLRGRNGGRVFYRSGADGEGYELLAKASKANEGKVIRKLQRLYAIKQQRMAG